jgi:thioredoxin-dependent peroxiredoxin
MYHRHLTVLAFSFAALAFNSTTHGKDGASGVSVGDPAPAFEAQDDAGKNWKSSDHVGKGPLVVYFYPADMTGGCTAQACGFRDRSADLKAAGATVVGVSGDTVESHQLFKKAHNLNFTLLADVDGKVAQAFGVPITEGSKTVNATIEGTAYDLVRDVTAKRWTFVIGTDGKVAYKDDAVKAKEDSEKILEVLKTLK